MGSTETSVLEINRNFWSPGQLEAVNREFEYADPDRVLQWGFKRFGKKMVLGTGFGPSGVFLIHRLHMLGIEIPVFFLDTDLLFEETYRLKKQLEQQFGIRVERVTPELSLGEQAAEYGDALWKRDPDRCCYLRKVKPLRDYLSGKKAWITGVRRSQSGSRRHTRVIEWDPANKVVKLNPVALFNDKEIWAYIREFELPYNPLHDDGYPSIGCIPCTEPVRPGAEDERAGRWAGREKTECGIHLPAQQPGG